MVVIKCIATFYLAVQFIRLMVFILIQIEWGMNLDERIEKYSVEHILIPKKANWYGFKKPEDKDFP